MIEIDAVDGFKIVSKTRQQIIMDVDPTKEVIRMSGKTMFLPADSPEMAWSMDEKMAAIDLTNTQTTNKITELENNIVYKVDLGSSNGLIFQNNNIQTEIYAIVYHGAEDITLTLPPEGTVTRLPSRT